MLKNYCTLLYVRGHSNEETIMTHAVTKSAFALLASLMLASTAFAGGSSETSDHFNALDANQDGAISVEEGQKDPTLSESWAEADTNQDNSIDPTEFSAFESMLGEQMSSSPEGSTEQN